MEDAVKTLVIAFRKARENEEIIVMERVARTISRYRMFTPEDRVIVSVSGGADSVCLAHVLRELGVNLAGVAHFNHKLRGEESDEDERSVAELAGALGVAFYRAEGRVEKGNLEQEARRARREFLIGLMRDGAGNRAALGHTRDDQAETVLFRVLRGSGLAGLAGILPVTGEGLVRPMIGVTRAEVRDYLRAKGIAWREDSSNGDARFARNRIRMELMPQLREGWNPRVVDALANLADLAYEEEMAHRDDPARVEFGVEELREMPRAEARRAIRAAIRRAKGDLRGIEFEHVERILEMDGARVRVPGAWAIRSCGRVAVTGNRGSVSIRTVMVPGTYPAPAGDSEIRLEPCVNLKVALGPLILRGWTPGDHYHPVGKSRDQKIKEMFSRARVPSWERRGWPILEYEGKIVWARQFGPIEGLPFFVSETLRPHQ